MDSALLFILQESRRIWSQIREICEIAADFVKIPLLDFILFSHLGKNNSIINNFILLVLFKFV